MQSITDQAPVSAKSQDRGFTKSSNGLHWFVLLKLGPGPSAVYQYLIHLATRKTGECHPAIKTIATDLGMHANTVRKHLQSLVDAGVITREERFLGNAQQSSSYVVRALDDADPDYRENMQEWATREGCNRLRAESKRKKRPGTACLKDGRPRKGTSREEARAAGDRFTANPDISATHVSPEMSIPVSGDIGGTSPGRRRGSISQEINGHLSRDDRQDVLGPDVSKQYPPYGGKISDFHAPITSQETPGGDMDKSISGAYTQLGESKENGFVLLGVPSPRHDISDDEIPF